MRLVGIVPLGLGLLLGLLIAGCGGATFLADGSLAVNVTEAPQALFRFPSKPAVLERFDALESAEMTSSDPNARAGANCAGGVCTIF